MNSAAHTAFQTSIDAGVAELVIDRPPVNALDSQDWLDLAHTLEALGQNPQVRVIVIRSEGRGFCAGVDIKELDAHPERIVTVNAGNYANFDQDRSRWRRTDNLSGYESPGPRQSG